MGMDPYNIVGKGCDDGLKKRNGIIMEWESSIWLVGWLGIRTVDGKLKYLFGLHSIAK
jgi:hypothetical protein